ncbi:MAG: 3-dehydroquinate synthase [Clostridia bacterium]|nr:3-dehydroquinate synthase [Clostridia bacterium]
MEELWLNNTARKSVIRCGDGAFRAYMPQHKGESLFVVTDRNVMAYYEQLLLDICGEDACICVLPAGESSKSMRNLKKILDAMCEAQLKRNSRVVAFGGGVVGDIAGLAASLYMRGINLTQVPTTLLAQVDSSVGGKTAIDYNDVKNLVGAFYQPDEVIVDPLFLQTLPKREVKCGLGEIVKYAGIDAGIFDALMGWPEKTFPLDFLSALTMDCIRHKARVVESDERDSGGDRKSLNMGHTTGHAFELYYKYMSHGEFVMIGMYFELYIARALGICTGPYADDLERLIMKAERKIPFLDNVREAAAKAKTDKKNDSSGTISVILPVSKGEWTEKKIPAGEYMDLIEKCGKEAWAL